MNNFAIIGGDVRNAKLAKMLALEGNTIYTYGIENKEELKDTENIINCKTIKEAVRNAKKIIGPIPFLNTIEIEELIELINEKTLIAGNIPEEVHNLAKGKNIKIIDIMKNEELAILNIISTVEGTIEIAISNTDKILQGSNILILGFGRIGKLLAKKMESLSTKVTCTARKYEDLAWIRAYGYEAIDTNCLKETDLSKYDIIINTIPQLILTKERLKYVNKECLLIDLASKPGGIDREEAKNRNLKYIWALALPGKVAPVTTAKFIKETIYHILNEI